MAEPTADDDVILVCRPWPAPNPIEHFLMTVVQKSSVRECEFCGVKVYFADASSEIFKKYPKTKLSCQECANKRNPDQPLSLLPETRADLVRTLGEEEVQKMESKVQGMKVSEFVDSLDDEVFCEEFQ